MKKQKLVDDCVCASAGRVVIVLFVLGVTSVVWGVQELVTGGPFGCPILLFAGAFSEFLLAYCLDQECRKKEK